MLAAIDGSISAMASIDSRIALPIAVRRPVASEAMTSSSTSSSFVGAWTISANPANATMPICVPLSWFSTKDEAASSAATSRLGGMSVAHMLRDTSIARTTVVRLVGTGTIAAGRAIASTRLPSPSTNSANGRWRRIHDDRGTATRTSDRLEKRTPVRRRRSAPDPDADEHRQHGEEHEQGRPQERHGIRPNQRSDATPPTRSSANPSAANSGVSSNGSVRTTSRLPTSS